MRPPQPKNFLPKCELCSTKQMLVHPGQGVCLKNSAASAWRPHRADPTDLVTTSDGGNTNTTRTWRRHKGIQSKEDNLGTGTNKRSQSTSRYHALPQHHDGPQDLLFRFAYKLLPFHKHSRNQRLAEPVNIAERITTQDNGNPESEGWRMHDVPLPRASSAPRRSSGSAVQVCTLADALVQTVSKLKASGVC